MEISLVDTSSIKIKGKQSAFLVNPTKKTKAAGDAVFLLSSAEFKPDAEFSTDVINSSKVTLDGPGEYEVSGIKIRGQRFDSEVLYTLLIDNLDVLLLRGESLEKAHGKIKDTEILLLDASITTPSSFIPGLNPRVVVLYGAEAQAVAKELGKEDIKPVSKYVITGDKIPTEMEIVVLG